MTAATIPDRHIAIVKDGAFYRVRAVPVGTLPSSVRQPETHGSHLSASMAAKILSDASGLQIIDRSGRNAAR